MSPLLITGEGERSVPVFDLGGTPRSSSGNLARAVASGADPKKGVFKPDVAKEMGEAVFARANSGGSDDSDFDPAARTGLRRVVAKKCASGELWWELLSVSLHP